MLISLEKIIEKFKIKSVYIAHFGAHHGQEVAMYQTNNFEEIHLFEPQSTAFELLESSYQNVKNIFLYNFGLGAKNSSNLLHLGSGDGQASSVLKPDLHKDLYPYIEFNDSEEIEIKKFDDLELNKINFLNIDIQGYELEALKGCENQLKSGIEYIYTEVNRKYVYKDCALIGEIDNYLNNFGFSRVITKWWNILTPWGDAFYIKKKKLSLSQKFILSLKKLLYLEPVLFFFYDLILVIVKFFNFVNSKFRNLRRRFIS